MSNLRNYIETRYNAKRPSATIVSIKKNKDGMLDEIKNETLFLFEHYESPSVNQMLYHYVNNIFEILTCPICNSPRQTRSNNTISRGEFYKHTCTDKECETRHRQIKTEEAVMSKYGASNIGQTQHWRDNVKKTNQRKRGVDWVTQSREEFVDNIDVINKRKNTFNKKYGKNTYTATSEFTDKQVETFNRNYGVNHPMQNAEYYENRAYKTFKFKDYKLPSGRIIKVQGYEPSALNILLEKYDESDLVIKDSNISKYTSNIMYKFEGKNRRYYPDIYIISENKIIEVKSKYTYEKDLDNNIAKMNACILSGMSFEFMILDK